MPSERALETRTGGRAATTGVIPGDVALSVGNPRTALSEGWFWRLLTDVARLESGHTPSRRRAEWWGGSIPWIGIRDATSNHGRTIYETEQYTNDDGIRNSSARVLPANTVCLSRTASVGYVVVMGVPMATSQDFVNWVCGPELNHRFLKYVLLAERKAFLRFASGTTHQTIYFPEVKAFHIAMPGLSTQRAIVDVLWGLDERIDLLRQTNATLESIAQALYKSWFIDFEPVRAKADGREPEGMDAATAKLFPSEFEESALGWTPSGWRATAIQDVVENVYDGPHATPPEASAGPVFLGIKNLTGTSIDLGEVRHIGEDDWARWTKRVTPQADDIVFSYEAALGLFALIPPGLRCCLGRRLALVRPKRLAGTPHFWFHQFVGAPFQRLLDKHTVQGATVNRIALKEFPSFTVLDPGEPLRTAFEAVVRPLWTRIHANRQQALNLTELRDTLLPRLISGKLRLPEAQAQLEDALA